MKKIHFSILINASKEKVWDTMLTDATYRQWTDVFNPENGSHFEGNWETGSTMRFIGQDKNGGVSGMLSKIKENQPYEYISIEHLGIIKDGKEDASSEEVKEWAGACENYTFKEKEGITELLVDMDTNDELKEMFEDAWPKALQILKELAEK